MDEPCLFEILDLSEENIRKVLPKTSTRSIIRLGVAYPRTAGRYLLNAISRCMSRPTLLFFQEEMNAAPPPTYEQIRSAERELARIIRQECSDPNSDQKKPPSP